MDERQSERVPQARRIRARAEEDRQEFSAHKSEWESHGAQREPGHDSGDRPASPVMRLQNDAGNQAVAGLLAGRQGTGLRPATIQASLSVGSAGDRFEREAETMADKVVSAPGPVAEAPAAAVASSTPGVQRSFLDDLFGGGGGGLGGMLGGETGYSVDAGAGGAGYGVGGLGGELGGAAGSASGGIGGLLSGARNRVREFGQGVWDRVLPGTREPVTQARDTARDLVRGAGEWAGDRAEDAWRGISGAGEAAGEWASDTASDVWEGVSGAGEAVGEWANDTAGDVWRGVSGAGEAAGEWASDTASDVWEGVSGAGEAVGGMAGDVWDQVSNAGSGVGDWAAGLFGGEEDELQTSRSDSASGADFDVAPVIERQLARGEGTGTALAPETRAFMEPRFGADFSAVRIHADADAARISRELTAEAFTHGRDIYMADGRYSPETEDGKHLLAHELTHVVQQTGAKA